MAFDFKIMCFILVKERSVYQEKYGIEIYKDNETLNKSRAIKKRKDKLANVKPLNIS